MVLGDILPLQIAFWIQSTIKYWPHYAKALCGVWNTTLVILLPTLYWLFISHRIKLNSNKWPMKTFKDLDHCLPFLSLHCPFSHQNSATLSFFKTICIFPSPICKFLSTLPYWTTAAFSILDHSPWMLPLCMFFAPFFPSFLSSFSTFYVSF